MALSIPIGIDDFKELRQCDYIMVDKTLMLQELLSDGTKSLLIARPRRFGKTLNMSMIKYFFDVRDAKENRKLFEGMLISQATYEFEDKAISCMDEQGQYPVVLLSLKDLKAANTYDGMVVMIRILMTKLSNEHSYLFKSSKISDEKKQLFKKMMSSDATKEEFAFSLQALTELLHAHYGRPVMLLVDEYDSPFHMAYKAKKPFHEDLIDFMGTFLGAAFKGNNSIKKGIMTGILRVSLMNLFSGVNNVVVKSVLESSYDRHFGFTEDEVSGLFKQLDRKQDETKIKAWYNGYQFGDVTIYNPWSILNCFANKDIIKPYWIGTGEHGVLGKALISCSDLEVFDQMKKLLDGNSIEIVVDERTVFATLHGSQRALWNLMLYSGYLTPVKQWQGDADLETHVEVRLPNDEVSFSIKRMVEDWVSITDDRSINSELLKCLISKDIEGFKDIVQRYILETISFYDFSFKTEERFYHIFMLGILLGLKNKFIIDSDKEAGLGRYDIILIPKDKKLSGVVIELKRVEVKSSKQKRELEDDRAKREDLLEAEALNGLDQIEKRGYGIRFAQHDVKQYVAIAMAFLGKEVSVRSKELGS